MSKPLSIPTKLLPRLAHTAKQSARRRWLYMRGQIPLDPATMTVVGNGDFRAEAVQVFKTCRSRSRRAGGSLNDIVKLNAYLTDLANFAVV